MNHLPYQPVACHPPFSGRSPQRNDTGQIRRVGGYFCHGDLPGSRLSAVRVTVNQTEVISNRCSYLRRTQRQPNVVKNYFHAEPVRYPAQ